MRVACALVNELTTCELSSNDYMYNNHVTYIESVMFIVGQIEGVDLNCSGEGPCRGHTRYNNLWVKNNHCNRLSLPNI